MIKYTNVRITSRDHALQNPLITNLKDEPQRRKIGTEHSQQSGSLAIGMVVVELLGSKASLLTGMRLVWFNLFPAVSAPAL